MPFSLTIFVIHTANQALDFDDCLGSVCILILMGQSPLTYFSLAKSSARTITTMISGRLMWKILIPPTNRLRTAMAYTHVYQDVLAWKTFF